MKSIHINFRVIAYFCFTLHLFISCNSAPKIFSQINLGNNVSEVLIIVYNKDNYCLGCDIGLQGFLLNSKTKSRFKKNIVTVLKEMRNIEKSPLEQNLQNLGTDNRFIYNTDLFNTLSSKFTSVPSSGGVIILDKNGKVQFETSFKDPKFTYKILQLN